MKYALYLVISFSFPIYGKSQFPTRYEVIPEHFEFPLGANDKLFDYGTVRPKKYNRTTYVVDGEVELLQPFTDQLLWHFSIHVLQGNEYRQYSMRKGDKLCTSSFKYRPMFMNWFKYITLPSDYTCPVPAGKYRFNNMAIQNQMMVAQPPKGNKFRINYTFFEDEKVISASAFYVTLNKQGLM